MTKTTAPAVKESSDDYTKITFSPDLAKFKMEKLDKDIVDLMSRRAYDVAASTKGVKVFLNDKRLPVKLCPNFTEIISTDFVYSCVFLFRRSNRLKITSVYIRKAKKTKTTIL